MTEFLARTAWWQLLILLFSFVLAIALVLLIIIIAVKQISKVIEKLKIKQIGQLHLGDADLEDVSPHAVCRNRGDIVGMLANQRKTDMDVFRRDARILKDQTAYMRSKTPGVQSLLQSAFLKELKAALKGQSDGLVDHVDYLRYQLCLFFVIEETKEIFLAAFIENHLASRTEAEFRMYAETKVAEVLADGTNYLNNAYHGTVVSRERLYDRNMEVMQQLRTIGTDIMYHARDLAVEGAKDIKQLEALFEKELEKIL